MTQAGSAVGKFFSDGVAVAILTAAMTKTFRSFLPFMLLATLPAAAQSWSMGAGTGPFVFGKFAERALKPSSEGPGTVVTKTKLTAATRPGLVVDFERSFNDRFALRLQGTFTESPLKVESENGGGVALNAGKFDVTTLTLPLIININAHGRLRFHVKGGPAYAIYHVKETSNPTAGQPFEGTRSRLGASFGAGVVWWWSDRFGVEGEVLDIVTSSPLRKSDFVGPGSISIPKPQNEHATVGVRWKF